MSSIIPHHTLIEKRCWNFVSKVPCGLFWDHRCELRVLLVPLRVKAASSVNGINGSNCRLLYNLWQNSRCMALSPGCGFCSRCGWNEYQQSSCNVRHTRVRETTRRVESLRVLVVGLRCTISRMLSCSTTGCWRTRSRWNMSTEKHASNALRNLENTLRSRILRIGSRWRYSSTPVVALPSQKT